MRLSKLLKITAGAISSGAVLMLLAGSLAEGPSPARAQEPSSALQGAQAASSLARMEEAGHESGKKQQFAAVVTFVEGLKKPKRRIPAPKSRMQAQPFKAQVQLPQTQTQVQKPRLLAAVDQPDILPRQRTLADTLLRLLPSGCDRQLKNLYVRYDHPANRGLGGKGTIILDGSVPDDEFLTLLTHECGHLAHAALSGTPSSGDSGLRDGSQVFYNDSPAIGFFRISWMSDRVRREGSRAEDFVSGYAITDMFEDFAETYTYYLYQRADMEARARTNDAIRRKLDWMEANYPNPAVPVSGNYVFGGKVPWDATKLPYTWNG